MKLPVKGQLTITSKIAASLSMLISFLMLIMGLVMWGYLKISVDFIQSQHILKNFALFWGCITSASIIAGIFLAMVISKRILKRPIKEMVKATEYISAGDVSQKANLYNRDELGNLAMSFNMMTGYLANLLRSITSYTGEIVKSCQSLNMNLKSTSNTSGRLVKEMYSQAGKTKEHVNLLKNCANLACDLVDQVEQSGLVLREKTGDVAVIIEGGHEPRELIQKAINDIQSVKHSLTELKKVAQENKLVLSEFEQISGSLDNYIERSRAFNFNIAVEVAKLGGKNMAAELEQLQSLADEGTLKNRDMLNKMKTAGENIEVLNKSIDNNITATDQGQKSISDAINCWDQIINRLATEKEAIEKVMHVWTENKKQGDNLLESLNYIMDELDKSLQTFINTGEAGKMQTELLDELQSTLSKMLRVSNTLNNLCLQFKT